MSIQDIFYTFGVIYMMMGIVLMIIIGVILFAIMKMLKELHKTIDEKLQLVNRITQDPSEVAFNVGSKVAGMAVKKVKEAMSKK